MKKFTSGPWTQVGRFVEQRFRRSSEGACIAEVTLRANVEEQEANGRLIAAAPTLLQVCKGARGYLEALPTAYRPDPQWLGRLIAAIRLAEGEERAERAAALDAKMKQALDRARK